MKTAITKAAAEVADGTVFLGGAWFDRLEARVRTRIGGIAGLLEAELDAALARKRYERPSLAEPEVAMLAPNMHAFYHCVLANARI